MSFTHDVYPGSDIPKNYSSLVSINPYDGSAVRDVLIYMNHPLRYGYYTFYQASFGQDVPSSVLQVVYNKSWYFPYVSSLIIALGMGFHFFIHLLAQDGADVCVCDVNEETLNETVEMLRKYNVSVSSHILDVSDKESIEALPQKVIDQHGKVDMVFNNAGVATGSHFKDMEEENWDWVMGINFDGVC